ncbi:MAG TPA: glycosyltransferase [Verrucomicrobiota bacterium]|jgi:glycosyltransferase involved in cell wall biosynthesis|nr:hypothetical protein [Limisphaerales bacterium]HRD03185.1 glycosyltransferase [Verrucomicrobiota bacterium]
MLTYNHEKYIAQAIESVLMQEINFPIELVIGEDCSTDGTREIVKQFAARRPDIIRPILHDQNIGMHRNGEAVGKVCRGEYIACLEGDDYWTAPDKLQKQVEFLDRRPDYSICGHRVMHIFEDRPECTPSPSPVQKESGTLEDILRWNYLPTCSVMYRAALGAERPAWFIGLSHGDWPRWALLAQRGRIGFINEVMARYRVHSGGVWMGASVEARLAGLESTIKAIHKHLNKSHPGARRAALFTLHLSGASQFYRQAHYAKTWTRLLRALASNPVAFAKSSEVRRLLSHEVRRCAVIKGLKCVKRNYYRARIWAGAERRKFSGRARALWKKA